MLKSNLINTFESLFKKKARPFGKFTEEFKRWNVRMLKNGETKINANFYSDSNAFNPVTKRMVKIRYDRRYKTRTIAQAFLKKYYIKNHIVIPKTQNLTKAVYWSGNTSVSKWDLQKHLVLNSNKVPELLRKQYKLEDGEYRLIVVGYGQKSDTFLGDISSTEPITIFNASVTLDDQWWKTTGDTVFRIDSAQMCWQLDNYSKVVFHFTKEQKLNYKQYNQYFLDGRVSHCLLQGIADYMLRTAETRATKSCRVKYLAKYNLIMGKRLRTGWKPGLVDIYNHGVPMNDIQGICNTLQIAIKIEQPFSKQTLCEFKSVDKPLKAFKFVNSRINHVDVSDSLNMFKTYDYEEKTLEELNEIYEKEKDTCIIEINQFGLQTIRALTNAYKLQSDINDTINKFEKETGLNNCTIDAIRYPEVTRFLENGCHFNGTIDFKNTSFMRDNKNIPDNMKHIDIEKAYTQFHKCKYYNGFMGQMTNFCKVDNYEEKGLYLIENVDTTKCSKKFIKIMDMLGWIESNNIYTDAELRMFSDERITFDVIEGVIGTTIDFRFENEMLTGKDIIKIEDKKKPIKIPYYSKWSGMIFSSNSHKSYYQTGDKRYFENIKLPEGTTIFYNDIRREAHVKYKKTSIFHKKHITAQLTAYQRLNLFEQLQRMDIDKIYRVCVDGIYYIEHEFKKDDIFRDKSDEMTFKNYPTSKYLSSLFDENVHTTYHNYNFKETSKFYEKELKLGAGGTGKTHSVMIDETIINPVYIAHSWLLAEAKQREYFDRTGKFLAIQCHSNVLNIPNVIDQYNYWIIDEVSMFAENEKKKIIEMSIKNGHQQGRIVFIGDVGFQCPPISEGLEMNKSGFDKVTYYETNYRFNCDKIKRILNDMRHCITNKKIFDLSKFKHEMNFINEEELKKIYLKEHLILTALKEKPNNHYCEVFSSEEFEKWKVTKNCKNCKNGQIVHNKITGVPMERRHAFTIHSIQGRTHKDKLYIDLSDMRGLRMLYTAFSRATKLEDIYIIYSGFSHYKFKCER